MLTSAELGPKAIRMDDPLQRDASVSSEDDKERYCLRAKGNPFLELPKGEGRMPQISLAKVSANYWTVTSTNSVCVSILLFLIYLAYKLGQNDQDKLANVLILLIGALSGWLVGMFFSPYSAKESERFASIGQTISAFISGYLVSKLDRFFEKTLYDEQKPNPDTWLRLALFTVSFLTSMILVFTNRLYFGQD
jgi:hypothetical protein